MTLLKVPIRRVGIEDNLILGAPKNAIIALGAACLGLFASFDPIVMAYSLAFWLVGLKALQKMTKYDPMLVQILLRRRKYHNKDYYPPHATPFRINSAAQKRRYKG